MMSLETSDDRLSHIQAAVPLILPPTFYYSVFAPVLVAARAR
eukprot:COSAG03_NODE_20350_length_320_cov_1.515837_2_plen_41_part_01